MAPSRAEGGTTFKEIVGTEVFGSEETKTTLTKATTKNFDAKIPIPGFKSGSRTWQNSTNLGDIVSDTLHKTSQDSVEQPLPRAGGTAWQFQYKVLQPHVSCNPGVLLNRTNSFATTRGGIGNTPCCEPGEFCSNSSPHYAGCSGDSHCDPNIAPDNLMGRQDAEYCNLW